MKRHPLNSGFTLTDLLVVISILAVLMAILFPVFSRAQRDSEKSKEKTCMSNMKQLGLGMIQYTQDYDETYPSGANPNGGGAGWAGQLYPYIKDPGVYMCPSDPTHGSDEGVHFSSYGYNSQFAPIGGEHLSQLSEPSKSVVLFEVQGSNGYTLIQSDKAPTVDAPIPGDDYAPYRGGSPAGYGVGGPLDPNGFGSNAGVSGGTAGSLKYATGLLLNSRAGTATGDFTGTAGRHQKGANYTFADGHVRLVLPANVSAGYPNTDSSGDDCGGSGGYFPAAAQTQCAESTITATFNTL